LSVSFKGKLYDQNKELSLYSVLKGRKRRKNNLEGEKTQGGEEQ